MNKMDHHILSILSLQHFLAEMVLSKLLWWYKRVILNYCQVLQRNHPLHQNLTLDLLYPEQRLLHCLCHGFHYQNNPWRLHQTYSMQSGLFLKLLEVFLQRVLMLMLLLMKVLMMVLMFMLILGNSPVVIVAFAPILTVDVTATAVAAISSSYHQSI